MSDWPSCPTCQSINSDWLTFTPEPNNIARLDFLCHACDHRWTLDVGCEDPLTYAYDADDDEDEDEYEDEYDDAGEYDPILYWDGDDWEEQE
jgi:hypothetical protein